MTDSQSRFQPLQSQLKQELKLTEQFLSILQEEAQILETGQPDDLNRTTSLKEGVAQELHSATQQRGALLEALNLPNNLQGLRATAQTPELSASVYDASGKKKATAVAADVPRLKPLKAG